MEQFLIQIVTQYPKAAMIIMALGIFRAVFKPVMSVIEAYVKATPSQADDATLEKVESSSVYKSIVWFVDYLTSIKLPK